MPTVVITTVSLHKTPGPHLEMLSAAGFEIAYSPRPELNTESETIEALMGSYASLAGNDPYTEAVLAALPKLKVISRNGVGHDRIDLEAATRHGVAATITPGGNYAGVA